MKHQQGLAVLLASTLASSAHGQTTYPCPSVGSSTVISASDSVIRVPITSATDGLCTLVRRNTATGLQRAPVARSYAGRDWEVSAGLFSNVARSGLVVDCAPGSATECDVTLPSLAANQEYLLESFERSVSSQAHAARFLERATFGATRTDIDSLVATELDYEGWIDEQIHSLKGSSLREFYRRRVNPKFEFSSLSGAVGSGPCELHSRWRRYAITSRDVLNDQGGHYYLPKFVTLHQMSGVAGYVWKVDGQIRTVTDALPTNGDGAVLSLDTKYALVYRAAMSWMMDCVGCPVYLVAPSADRESGFEVPNPIVSLSDLDESTLDIIELPDFKSTSLPSIESSVDYPMYDTWIKADENALLNTTSLEGSGECDGLEDWRLPMEWDEEDSQPGTFGSIFAKSTDVGTSQEIVFAYDRHLTLYENTVENPIPDGGGSLVLETTDSVAGDPVKCHNVPRTFYNEDHCTLSTSATACEAGTEPSRVIILDDATLSAMRDTTGLPLYAVTGLILSTVFDVWTGFNAPCADNSMNQFSRWIKDPTDTVCENDAAIGDSTYALYQDLIHGVPLMGDHNGNVVDSDRDYRTCDAADEAKTYLGKVKAHDGACWHHVHLDEMDVVDLSGVDTNLYTVSGNTVTFASTDAFESGDYPVIGKLGDHIDLNDSPMSPLDQQDVQDAYGTLEYNPAQQPILICGSPEEIASDPFHGDYGFDTITPLSDGLRTYTKWEHGAQKHTVWTHLAMHAPDQLRQKMAWSLSQIVSVGAHSGREAHDFEDTEAYLAFYDMFVKNGFGNYRELMREFSFSNIMSGWLSFQDNRSLQYNIDNDGVENYPDENFAREIMQLFSVGLYKLNMDGSILYQANGNIDETYGIDDIVSYSRAWTGFRMQTERGGASPQTRGYTPMSLDPMMIDIDRRDWFPKNNLHKGFLGDKVARCVDLPDKHFLRVGATYRLLGARGKPELHQDADLWSERPDFLHLELKSSSPLYAELCAEDGGVCTFPAKVKLDQNLVYDDDAKTGAEYTVDTIRTVKIKDVWYEYVRQPCTEHPFFMDGKRVTQDQIKGDGVQAPSMCANPLLASATAMCSEAGWETESKDGEIYCHYQGERMTYSSAENICAENGQEQGYAGTVKEWKAGPCGQGITNYGWTKFRSWANEGCGVQVKVEFLTGQISVVHSPWPDKAGNTNVETHVTPDTLNSFDAPWDGAQFPTMSDCLENEFCSEHGDDHCICDTFTSESLVYTNAEDIGSIDTLMDTLHIGSVDPAMFDDLTYSDLGCSIEGVTVYSKSGDCSSLTDDTVFSFEWKSKPMFLRNLQSTVTIEDTGFSFRNPVGFISLSDPEARDAYHETEEVLDSLFYDSSHPPFMAVRIIQRFGVSNPSPAFIERVATAYTTGSYGSFGSGKYGDLGAMVAAILLDDETRSVTLDADQTSGHLREPLIKVLSFFRTMGLHYASPMRIPTLMSMQDEIGQGSFENPSVFSFFLPEHAPSGGVQSAGLVAPEGQVLQSDNILFQLDAYWGATKFGLVDCFGMSSFMNWRFINPFGCPDPVTEGDTSHSPAKMSYWPQSIDSADDILDELDILLTSGRLQDKNRAIIKSVIDPIMDDGDIAKVVRSAQQLILASPEFHSTNLPRNEDSARVITGYSTSPKASYKAVVVLMMTGGMDSFNLLVPKCADDYDEYASARGLHAIPKEDLTDISAVGSSQACNDFGVNKHFPVLSSLYSSNELSFFANAGVVSRPMTKHDDWKNDAGFTPFAHNTMQNSFYTSDIYFTKPGTGVFGRILDVLKVQGLQTSANSVDNGFTMLTGDQEFNNPVYTVSTKAPSVLNNYPTVENLVDVVKSLNGVGETGNSLMGEYWSSRVATALFEQEQMLDIAAIPEFVVTDYPETSVKLTSSFKAIAGYIKSREYRKVNRDVFVLTQGGYDMHNEDELADRFGEANGALEGFIQEVRDQGLWDNTAIISGSDFGRTMNTNSNGGTDHAWGGNYFMAGGSVQGGKIMGNFPSPIGPDSDYWLDHGRWIPTTPWESVFNAVAQWLGVHDDADLDLILPNRKSFKSHELHDMCDLFTDKDLFTDGACQCELVGGVQTTVCDQITYSPTVMPTESPSLTPSGNPTTTPTAKPTTKPSASPSLSPTNNPTADLPDNGFLVANILEGGSVTHFGCNGGSPWKAIDKSTDKWYCDRSGLTNTEVGLEIKSGHGQLTIPKALRLYPANACANCGVGSFVLYGRMDSDSPWVEIDSSEISAGQDTNQQQIAIDSTYSDGDPDLKSTTVHFHSHGTAYLDYKLTLVPIRSDYNSFHFAELEIPGMLMPPDPTASPTLVPSISPTVSPSLGPTTPPTKSPSVSPSLSPTDNPTTDLPDNGFLVANILEGGSVTHFGCNNEGSPWKAIDKSTNKWYCERSGLADTETGLEIKSGHGQLTIPKALRLYPANACPACGVASFVLYGRMDSDSPWVEIDSSEISAGQDSNQQQIAIDSSYSDGDPDLKSTTVHFPSHGAAYLDYKLTLVPLNNHYSSFHFAELEIPGMLMPPDPTTSPTLSPSVSPSKTPIASPTASPTDTPTAALPSSGTLVSNILAGGTATNFGCSNTGSPGNAIDGTTTKYFCSRTGVFDEAAGLYPSTGVKIIPTHGQLTIAKALRFYPANGCFGCDPISYVLEGRLDSASEWVEIDSSEIPGIADGSLGRNQQSLDIYSEYSSGDAFHQYATVEFPSHGTAYLEYKLSFTMKRLITNSFQFAEVEIPGMLLPAV